MLPVFRLTFSRFTSQRSCVLEGTTGPPCAMEIAPHLTAT